MSYEILYKQIVHKNSYFGIRKRPIFCPRALLKWQLRLPHTSKDILLFSKEDYSIHGQVQLLVNLVINDKLVPWNFLSLVFIQSLWNYIE